MKEKNAVPTRHAKEMSSAVRAAFPSPLCLAYSAIMTAGISRYIPPNTANPKTARKTDKTDTLLDTECTFEGIDLKAAPNWHETLSLRKGLHVPSYDHSRHVNKS